MSGSFWNKAVERAVRRGTGASAIDEVEELQSVWGGNGMVFRVELAGAEVASVVVKYVALPSGTRRKKKSKDASLARTLASYDNELTFYEHYSREVSAQVRLPHFHAGQRLEEGWLFVLEDLADSGFALAKKSYSASDVRGALHWLAHFHATFLGNAGEGLWKSGSYWNLSVRQDELLRMQHPKLRAVAGPLDAALNRCRYKTLIHGDAKTDNFCFRLASGESTSTPSAVAGLDFQYVGLGCGMKDVMCLLDSCLGPSEAATDAPDHLEHYFAELRTALCQRDTSLDAAAVETEWRALYPVAWADYYRFLDGWAPGRYPPQGHADEMFTLALQFLAQLR